MSGAADGRRAGAGAGARVWVSAATRQDASGAAGQDASDATTAAMFPPVDSSLVAARVAAQFDSRAERYDNDNDYHPPLAAKLIQLAAPADGESVLDVACGTGLVALKAAEAVGPRGRVVGVDLSEGMLVQARAKAAAAGMTSWTEWVHGDAEDYSGTAGGPGSAIGRLVAEGGADVITCSAALPFFRDIPTALARWRAWLKPGSGRLAFNSFVAPAVLDYGTFIRVAARHGLAVTDPCARLGTAELIRAALAAAGFRHVSVEEEPKARYTPAASVAEYAEKMWQTSATANPFGVIEDAGLGPADLEALRNEALAEIAAGAAERFEPGRGVRSPYTVLHVLARP